MCGLYTFPGPGTWHSVIVALPPDVVSGDMHLEEVLSKLGSLEVFCLNPPSLQEMGLEALLGDASELTQGDVSINVVYLSGYVVSGREGFER
jgi:hypothetical protein